MNRPKPIVKKMRWPFPLIWLVPVLAAALAGYYFYDRYEEQGALITLKFADASGLQPGQTRLMHLGVVIGQVVDSQLDSDQKQVLVHVRIKRSNNAFARQGAVFWVVRPQISAEEISGLSTVLSGPFIDANPGSGEIQTEFTGLPSPPASVEDGLRIILKVPRVERLQGGSPINFRGIQVGVIEDVLLSPDASSVNIQVFIHRRYAPLVRTNSVFWIISGVDLKGGLFGGIEMKVESLRSLLSGGISFATPVKNIGAPAQNSEEFLLHDEPQKDWLEWAPKIPIVPDSATTQPNNLPQMPGAIRSAVGS